MLACTPAQNDSTRIAKVNANGWAGVCIWSVVRMHACFLRFLQKHLGLLCCSQQEVQCHEIAAAGAHSLPMQCCIEPACRLVAFPSACPCCTASVPWQPVGQLKFSDMGLHGVCSCRLQRVMHAHMRQPAQPLLHENCLSTTCSCSRAASFELNLMQGSSALLCHHMPPTVFCGPEGACLAPRTAFELPSGPHTSD